MIAAIVDWGALWETIWHAAASGLVVSAVVGLSVRSYARSHDLRLAGDGGRASAHVLVAVLSAAAGVAVAGYGLYLIAF